MFGLRRLLGVLLLTSLLGGSIVLGAPPPPDDVEQARDLLEDADIPWPLETVYLDNQTLIVCLSVPVLVLRADGGLGAEAVQQTVRRVLTPIDWRVLRVYAPDPESGRCRALSSFLSQTGALTGAIAPRPLSGASLTTKSLQFPRSLEGKTVYVSAGHGWRWSGWTWRTQRGVTEGIIEDHNNAEAVDQYLIPYLENAGATVIPVRERDWNAARVIVDNDDGAPDYVEAGAWATSGGTGYVGGTYRFASTVAGVATATATWHVTVPETGTYALYAWVLSGWNRAPDAHYTVHHAAGTSEVRLDQRIRPQTWRYLGTFPFYAGTATVTLDNASTTGGGSVVIADALRLGGGNFDSLDGIVTDGPSAPDRPWWETATFYYSQWMGLNYDDWEDFNDVVARPMFSRWNHAGSGEDAIYVSWHTNGYTGTSRGTESYVHNGDTYSRTLGSLALQGAIHDELIHDIAVGWDAGWLDRGKKQADLGELRMLWDADLATQIPGVLLEIAFHDNPDDARALKEPRFNRLAARAVYQGIVRYFAARDGVDLVTAPEPPMHVRVQNVGGGAVRVAWAPSPVDAVGLGGEAATGYRLYTSPDGFAWSEPVALAGTSYTLSGLADGETVYARVTAVNDGGESFPTEVLGARVGEPMLLIVNGFDKLDCSGLVAVDDPTEGENRRMWVAQMNARDYVVHHGDVVPSDYAWDSASNEAVADGSVALQDYRIVDWLLGEESEVVEGTLSAAERAALATYLDSGRALLIGGTDLARDLASRAPIFLCDVLHTGYVVDNADTFAVQAVSDGVFVGLADFSFDMPGEYRADAADGLTPLEGAATALRYVGGTGGTAAVAYAADCERLLVTGFPLEVVPSAPRAALMVHALDYLDYCLQPHTTIVTPQAGSYYSTTPTFAGTAVGWTLSAVSVQVQRDSDGTFWDDSRWGGETWLAPDGVDSWRYVLPTLDEGSYTLRARGMAELPDPSPAEATFTMDTTAPLTPTLITPTGSLLLRTPLLALRWEPLVDGGAPLTYQLVIGSQLFETTETVFTTTLLSDVYTWRVRAIDAAGNVGPWSLEATFEVDVTQVYLPLVLR